MAGGKNAEGIDLPMKRLQRKREMSQLHHPNTLLVAWHFCHFNLREMEDAGWQERNKSVSLSLPCALSRHQPLVSKWKTKGRNKNTGRMGQAEQ